MLTVVHPSTIQHSPQNKIIECKTILSSKKCSLFLEIRYAIEKVGKANICAIKQLKSIECESDVHFEIGLALEIAFS